MLTRLRSATVAAPVAAAAAAVLLLLLFVRLDLILWGGKGRKGLVNWFKDLGEVWDAELVGMEKDKEKRRARNTKYENKFNNIDRRGGVCNF